MDESIYVQKKKNESSQNSVFLNVLQRRIELSSYLYTWTSGSVWWILRYFYRSRHYKLESEIASMTWRVDWSDVMMLPHSRTRGSLHSLAKRGSQVVSFPTYRRLVIPTFCAAIHTSVFCRAFQTTSSVWETQTDRSLCRLPFIR